MVITFDNELLIALMSAIILLVIAVLFIFVFYLCCCTYNLSLKNDFLKHHIQKKKKEIK